MSSLCPHGFCSLFSFHHLKYNSGLAFLISLNGKNVAGIYLKKFISRGQVEISQSIR